ncbi:helix-turn-helix domain-containing protein [Mycoplasmatota bacterium]|nr:helix-turn-helix domain-containing protein [Mycoplasmatota bacterium]
MSMLTVDDVAKRWRCCRLTVISYIKKGKLKSFKIGPQYRIREKWVEEFENNFYQPDDKN